MSAWWDRVRDAPVERPPEDAIPGRYVLGPDAHVPAGELPMRIGDQLAPDASGQWSTAQLGGTPLSGRFAKIVRIDDPEDPDSFEGWAIRAIARRLDPEADGSIAWSRLTSESPLVQPTAEHLNRTPIDHAWDVHGPHLLEVFRRPHTVLDTLVEPTRASRAKRIAPGAIEHLAEHAEDWQKRTTSGVIPLRILAQRIDEQLDVYENRVAVGVADELLTYLRRRLAQLRLIINHLQTINNFSEHLSDQHHRRAERLGESWGDVFTTGDQLDRGGRLRNEMRERRRLVGGLQDTAMYRAVPRRARVRGPLRQTNVLTNHQHYRRVAALAHVLERERAKVGSREAQYIAWQTLMRAFDAFCLQLVGSAARRMGFEAEVGASISVDKPGHIALAGPLGRVDLRWDPWRGATLAVDGGSSVRFVPLAVALAGGGEGAGQVGEHELAEEIRELTERLPGADRAERFTVLLHPGLAEDRITFPPGLRRALNADEAGLSGKQDPLPALVPVNPLDLLSLERVERVVRRVVLVDLFERYPAQAACRRNVHDRATRLVAWLQPAGSMDYMNVTEPPDRRRLDDLDRAIKAAKAGLDGSVSRGLDAFREAVAETHPLFERLCHCPVCDATGIFSPRGSGCFFVHCRVCDARWGLDRCGSCQARVPFLDAKASADDATDPDRLDRYYGRDVLAVPSADPDREGGFVCPRCHAGPGSVSG
jgi:hypothetical protein